MRQSKMFKVIGVSVITAGLLVGCGGGSTTTTNGAIGTGTYVDSAVEGVTFNCGTQRGTTDVNGTFSFEKGQDCTFKLGELVLREVPSSDLNDSGTILEDNPNIAQLLQSMDEDGDARNGIKLPDEAIQVINESGITAMTRNDINDTHINDVVTRISEKNPQSKGRFVSREEAVAHVSLTRRNLSTNTNNTNNTSNSSNSNNSTNMGNSNNSTNMGNSNNSANMGNSNNSNNSNNMGNSNNSNNMGNLNNSNNMGNSNNSNNMGNSNNLNNMGNSNNSNNMGNSNNSNNMSDMMNSTTTQSSTLNDFNYQAFSKPLAVPALAPYTVDSDGYKVFNMDINASTTAFFEGINTTTYGINSNILGQTIRMHNGDKIKLVYKNNLTFPTTIHGHGMHVPAIMDGGPVNKIQPNTSWTAQYTVNQKACTNWYHPHLMGKTAEDVYMGLAGFIIIDDAESDALNLPKEYGVDDIPVAIQDKRFDAKGQIDYSPSQMETRMGYKSDVMMANGVILPYVDVPAKKVRLRLLNGSNASVYKLQFSDGRKFSQIAVDNSFLESPVNDLTSVTLTPSERAEIVVDYTNDMGKEMTLVNANTNLDIMKIKVDKAATTTSDVAAHLTTLEKYDPADAVRTRQFVLNMARGDDGKMHMAINGKLMDIKRIDEQVPVNDIEIWEITNQMGMTHNFHMHATHFFPLERNGSPANILPNEQGYKDVISMPGNSTMKVIVKMTDFVTTKEIQPNGAKVGYMYHCHFLEHEDDGMMGQFAVTDGAVAVNVRP